MVDQPSAAPPQSKPPRSALALGLSVLLPGLGHAVVGRGVRAAAWLATVVALWAVSAVLSAWWLAALAVGGALTAIWYVACAIDAYRQRKTEHSSIGWIPFAGASALTWTIAPLGLSMVIRGVSLEAFKVPSGSMCPTFEVGDHFFLDKTAHRHGTPRRGEVVVYARDGADFVHRIVAIAGDELTVQDGRVTINGKPVTTSATGESACGGEVTIEGSGGGHLIVVGTGPPGEPAEARVPPEHVYVLGDNRDNSADSRMFGPVHRDEIEGRAWRIWLRRGGVVWQPVR